MENNTRMLKELATLDVLYQPWCIQYPQLEPTQSYKLKSGLIYLLPKSTQTPDEIPCDLFHDEVVGDTGGLHQDEDISFFPRPSCKRLAILTIGYVQHLGDMKHMFLEKFFPASITATIRKEICGIRQHSEETLHEYWE
ncbi:hypothetical protein CR513_11683, partial [Mucuna pruriens]